MRPHDSICHAVSYLSLTTEAQTKQLRFTHIVNIKQKQDFKAEQLQSDSELITSLQCNRQKGMERKTSAAPLLPQRHSAFV